MPERPAPVVSGIVAVAAGACLAVFLGNLPLSLAAGAAVALGHLVTMSGSGGRHVPATLAGLVGVALVHGDSPVDTAAAALLGVPPGIVLVRLRHGARAASDSRLTEPPAAAAFALLVAVASPVLPEGAGLVDRSVHIAVTAAAAGLWHVVDSVVWAVWSGHRRRLSARLWVLRRLAGWQPPVILFVAGAMYAEAAPVVGWWAVVVSSLPYLFGHLAVNRLGEVRTTYRQTIRALGRLPEAGGFVVPGHAERTADLAVATGAEIGCGARESDNIEYASLLHDLGRVVLADRSVTAAGYGTGDIAEWSAAIIAESKHLEEVAEIVASYPRPYRSHGEARSGSVPRAAKLLKTASAYDDSVAAGSSPVDALEQLHRGAAYDYDPEIVLALRRVLERRSVIVP